MGSVLVTVRTVDDQAVPAPIDGVLVRVYDNADTFITEGLTGSGPNPGEVQFTLDGNTPAVDYLIRPSKDGVSFPPAPLFGISVLDPPDAGNNTFEFTGHVGSTAVLVTLVVKDELDAPLEDILIRVYSEADVFLGEATTNASGEVVLALEGDEDPGKIYLVRLSTPGRNVEGGPTQQILVLDPLISPATNTFDFVAALPTMPESQDENMCLLSGYFVDTANRPLRNVHVRCIPLFQDPSPRWSGFPGGGTPAVIGRNQVLREAVFESGDDGYIEILLPRGSTHEVHIHGYEIPGFPTIAPIFVPDASSAKLEDIFFPFTLSVDFDTDSVSLAVDETQELEVTIINSDTRDLSDDLSLLSFSSSDEDVATVNHESGHLIVRAIGVGTATVLAERADGTWSTRVPPVPELTVMPVTIEVIA
jgi:hypothetical protein